MFVFSLQAFRAASKPITWGVLVVFALALVPLQSLAQGLPGRPMPVFPGVPQGPVPRGEDRVTLPERPPTSLGSQIDATAVPFTGEGGYRFAFQLPQARGRAQPSLSVSYSRAVTASPVGPGWTLSVPVIFRVFGPGPLMSLEAQAPTFRDRGDRFVSETGGALVYLCTIEHARCHSPGAEGEAFPGWADGWAYFRSAREE